LPEIEQKSKQPRWSARKLSWAPRDDWNWIQNTSGTRDATWITGNAHTSRFGHLTRSIAPDPTMFNGHYTRNLRINCIDRRIHRVASKGYRWRQVASEYQVQRVSPAASADSQQ
jgi:hypothetical protein